MIKINLASKKSPVTSAGGGGTGSGLSGLSIGNLKLPDLGFDPAQLKELPLVQIAMLVGAAVILMYAWNSYRDDELAKLDVAMKRLDSEKVTLTAQLSKVQSLDAVKKSIEGDETVIRSKIDTIQKLIAGRQEPPKILSSISAGMPPEVWLSQFQIAKDKVVFKGYSLGFQQISTFMKNIGESAYFTDLHLVDTKKGKDDTGLEVATFELSAKRR